MHALLHLVLADEPRPRDDEPRRRCAATSTEAEALGVREYYFTGGEPFLNREILEIIEAALALGPVTVLTNGVLIRPETARAPARALRRLALQPRPARLDRRLRTPPTNDPIRGAGTFERIVAGHRATWPAPA